MKKLIILISLVLLAMVGYGQVRPPYKVQNPKFIQVYDGDTARVYIYNTNGANNDSIWYGGDLPAYFGWDMVYWPGFVPGLGDTNILFVNGTTGLVGITTPAAIGGAASSKWTYTGTTLHPLDTNKFVAVGTNDADTFNLWVDKYFNMVGHGFIQSHYIGRGAGNSPTNLAFGENNLSLNTTGINNTAIGRYVLDNNTSGEKNTGVGFGVLTNMQTGIGNTAVGADAAQSNISGSGITAIGYAALQTNTNGIRNTAVGGSALYSNDTGRYNTALGWGAGTSCYGSKNVFLGYLAGTNQRYVSNRLFIDNQTRGDSIADFKNALIYGIFDADSSNQYIYLNGNVHIGSYDDGYLLPFLDGNAGEVLTTNGSGTVSWQPASGGDTAFWQKNSKVLSPVATDDTVIIGATANVGTERFGVTGGSVLFSGTTGTTPTSGAGTRLMWIPAKGAFRAGKVTSTLWDAANIGNYSGSGGEDAYASGTHSFCWGSGQGVTGNYSASFGQASDITNAYSFGAGYNCDVSGTASALFGALGVISGDYAFGANLAITNQSYASSVFGRYNVATGTAGSWVSTDPLFQIGNGTGTGGSSNDAFKVLKNGDTYIADGSSSTDPIMTVKATDSTTTIIGDVNQSGGFANFNMAYGSYLDTTDQSPYSGKKKAVRFNVIESESGMSLSASDTVITFAVAGKYLITFSAVMKPSAANKVFDIWVCKNGNNHPMSNTTWTSVGTVDRVITVTFILDFAVGNTLEVCWYTDDASALLNYTTSKTSPDRPVTPSIVLTVNKVSN